MDGAKTTILQRLIGPHIIHSLSPMPPTSLAASESPSCKIFPPKPTLSPSVNQSEFIRPTVPSPTLSTPRTPKSSKPSVPKIRLAVPLFQSYACGPNGPGFGVNPIPGDITTAVVEPITVMPRRKLAESFDRLRDFISELEVIRAPSANLQSVYPTYSDLVLEEMGHLGEGTAGIVHKVKSRRTGLIMARKTITTREVPVKQLMREVSIGASADHINIIKWHGAYMSPSSSEIKILM